VVFGGQLVGLFAGEPVGEWRVAAEIAPDVATPPLDELACETLALGPPLGRREVIGKLEKGSVEEADEFAEGSLIARVRRCSDQKEVASQVVGEGSHELVALVSAAPPGGRVCAGMRLIDNHELRRGAKELVAAAVALDEVGRDDRDRVPVEQRLVEAEAPLQPGGG
jgi:hypothetical protein